MHTKLKKVTEMYDYIVVSVSVLGSNITQITNYFCSNTSSFIILKQQNYFLKVISME